MKTRNEINSILKAMFNPPTTCHRLEMDYPTIKALALLEVAELEETQNNSPTIMEFLEFYESNGCSEEEVIFETYIVTDREDTRVTIEGILLNHSLSSERCKTNFIESFREADEFELGESQYRAWWD